MDISNFRRLLVPSPLQLTFCLALSLAILIGTNWPLVIGRFVDPTLLGPYIAPGVHVPTTLADNELISKLVVALFWGTIGLIAYTLVWGFLNLIIEARNEVAMETTYVNKGRLLHQRLIGSITQIGLAVLLFSLLILTALVTIPIWVDLFADFFIIWQLSAILQLVISVLGTFINAYLIWVLTRMVFLAA